MGKYSIGIDFGTLSARAVVVDIANGEVLAVSEMKYSHGVMSELFLNNEKLPKNFALQHPQDYLDTMRFVVKDAIRSAKIRGEEIVGVGVDFTASTIMPVTEDGTPLCFLKKFKNRPHSYVKLWKHHAAQKEADEINVLAKNMNESWLNRYGGSISSEWMFPKIYQILKEDEEIYEYTGRFIEAADWIIWQLTGEETHSVCTAGFKAMWSKKEGYPRRMFFRRLDGRLEHIIGDKVSEHIIGMDKPAGRISKKGSELLGIKEGTPVAPAIIDAHAALPSVGVVEPGSLLIIIGTSSCHILLGEREVVIPGISGVVKDGIMEGYYAYEAGQACIGDCFHWFIKNCVPYSYMAEADKNKENIHTILRKKAEKVSPGSNGLLALDWWNGNRTPYGNADLKGIIYGLTINTKPEEIYRALIEATAYGTRQIIELYETNGVPVKQIFAAGGIAEKDPLLLQIYADVTGREIRTAGTAQTCAHGSAIFGAVSERGYNSLAEAAKTMAKTKNTVYKPNMKNFLLYTKLYEAYKELSCYFVDRLNE
ncbi:ribulokinase [Ructibacterium gallinarum]|uniref:Ribulokinase n=1 Tax=Ructibacterium gallinarum TaxID=2779355 RepID=A0A9D5M5L0_9FIRM|nr:ribulokinase [Ructibacterium gallinarum]MBE5041030.1 ribulokinase [Ructibacterium gallinarum]